MHQAPCRDESSIARALLLDGAVGCARMHSGALSPWWNVALGREGSGVVRHADAGVAARGALAVFLVSSSACGFACGRLLQGFGWVAQRPVSGKFPSAGLLVYQHTPRQGSSRSRAVPVAAGTCEL
jgi:hypothetical protein